MNGKLQACHSDFSGREAHEAYYLEYHHMALTEQPGD